MTTKGESGLIIAHYGVTVEVRFSSTNNRHIVRIKRNSGHVVGDMVVVQGKSLTRMARQTELRRMDARGAIHVIGANLDVLCIVVCCEPLSPPGFIDRAIVAARIAGLWPVLVINKSDLPCFNPHYRTIKPIYGESIEIFTTSATENNGLEAITKFFSRGHRGIFVGPTGVGKSSLMNSLLPELALQTGRISKTKKRGRHTTSVSTLHTLSNGGELIDSPGFNDFGLVDISPQQLASHFPGFAMIDRQPCKFRDCKHRREPGCTIGKLVEEEKIDKERYLRYLYILTEVEALAAEPRFRQKRHRRKKDQ